MGERSLVSFFFRFDYVFSVHWRVPLTLSTRYASRPVLAMTAAGIDAGIDSRMAGSMASMQSMMLG